MYLQCPQLVQQCLIQKVKVNLFILKVFRPLTRVRSFFALFSNKIFIRTLEAILVQVPNSYYRPAKLSVRDVITR